MDSLEQKPKKKIYKHWWFWVLAIIIIFIFIGIGNSSKPEKVEEISQEKQSSQEEQKTKSISVGDEGIINWHDNPSDCSELNLVAITRESYEKLLKAQLADDKIGIAELILSGEILSIPNCTKVKVIDRTTNIRQIRILEGDLFGKSGWVPYEFVKALE